MALTPIDENHALQIQAGTLGRKAGHAFEDSVTDRINNFVYPVVFDQILNEHLNVGDPGSLILNYIASTFGQDRIDSAVAISTGALATSEEGKRWLEVNGVLVKRCKSDLILTVDFPDKKNQTFGISTKQCNNNKPTNAQLFFTSARAFSDLLRNNGVDISDGAVSALRQFCGDDGYRPSDDPQLSIKREADLRRFFWEEIEGQGRNEWETVFADKQDFVTRLLFQKAYLDDPFAPDFVLHKTKKAENWDATEIAVYSIDELIEHSRSYGGYSVREYSVKGIRHKAPRFGIIQMQRGGQKQHPTQLQFNLQAGYFYKIKQTRP